MGIVEMAAAALIGGFTMAAMACVIWLLRWAINHGVDRVAALFGRGPKAKR